MSGDRDGPLVVVTTRLTCDGCKHLHKTDWVFEGENDDIDRGTDASCTAMHLRHIDSYWNSRRATPDWCPRRIEVQ